MGCRLAYSSTNRLLASWTFADSSDMQATLPCARRLDCLLTAQGSQLPVRRPGQHWQDGRVHRVSRRWAALPLVLTLAFALAGCVRVHAAMAVGSDDHVSGSIDIATVQGKADDT